MPQENRQLSEHFSFDEFTRSATAQSRGIDNVTPALEKIEELTRLATFMEFVRDALGGHPIQITSGFRCEELNAAIGGASNSQHKDGHACDFLCPGFGSPDEICDFLVRCEFPYDQLIYERDSRGNKWVHISIADVGVKPRGQVLNIQSGITRTGLG